MADDFRPKLKWGSGYKLLGHRDDAQIIVQVRSTAAVVCPASTADARSALTPLAGSPDVLAAGIQGEDVGAAVPALSSSLEPSARGGKALEVNVIGDIEQQVNVLRVWLFSRQGADERDFDDAKESAGGSYEAEGLQKEELAQGRQIVLSAAHEGTLVYGGGPLTFELRRPARRGAQGTPPRGVTSRARG